MKEAHHDRFNRMRVIFKTIVTLAPGAALVLAAEIDRWRRDFGFKPVPFEIENWNPQVRDRLIELGLFDLLDVPANRRPPEQTTPNQTKMIRLLSETKAPGAACTTLRNQLETVAGTVPARTYFHDGVSEAMANVGHHAYPPAMADAAVPWLKDRWWATGSYNPKNGSLRVLFYDQGVGIPATLLSKVAKDEKQKNLLKWIFAELARLNGDKSDEGKLIQAALTFPRSSTGEANRGYGLTDIRAYVENSRAGTLRILSGRGEIAYVRGGNMETKNHKARFTGTLIEWEVFRDVNSQEA